MSQREWTSEDYIMMVRRRWPIMLVLAVVGGLAAYGVSRLLPNRYTSQAVVLVQQGTREKPGPILGAALAPLAPLASAVEAH